MHSEFFLEIKNTNREFDAFMNLLKLLSIGVFSSLLLCSSGTLSAASAEKGKPAAAPTQNLPVIRIETDHADAIYKKGEEIKFTIHLQKDGKNLAGEKIKYVLREENHWNPVKSGEFVSSDAPFSVSWKMNRPGSVQIYATLLGKDGKPIRKDGKKDLTVGIGAMVDPLSIKPGAVMPDDFDAFWKSCRDEVSKIPMNPKLVKVNSRNGIDVYDVTIDCAGGKPVRGYLMRPAGAKAKSLKAMVSYQGAGVYNSFTELWWGRGVVVLNINAHGIPNGQSKEFYANLNKGELKGYPHFGKEDRDKFYFRGMYMRVMRSLDFIKSLPEWDGKTLIVRGGSQGGGQAIAAAALDPQVSLCVAGVPALSDHAGSKYGYQSGWPRLYHYKNGKPENEKIAKTAEYFDNVNFARKITCEIFLSTGFMDFVCSPTSVYAVYNTLPAGTKKSIQTYPSGHHGTSPNKAGEKRILEVLHKK